jgi:hypothetical protein
MVASAPVTSKRRSTSRGLAATRCGSNSVHSARYERIASVTAATGRRQAAAKDVSAASTLSQSR